MNETLLIKLILDIKQPVSSFEELEKRLDSLKKALNAVPKAGTEEFEQFARTLSETLGVSVDEARQRIIAFQNDANREIKQGTAAVNQFKDAFATIPQAAGVGLGTVNQQVKTLDKSVDELDKSTEQYADTLEELTRLRSQVGGLEKQIASLKDETKKTAAETRKATAFNDQFAKSLQSISGTLKKAFGLASARAAIGTLSRSIQGLITDYGDVNPAVGALDKDLQSLKRRVDEVAISFIEANQEGISKFIGFLKQAVPFLAENAGTILKVVAALALYVNRQKIASATATASVIATKAYNVALGVLSGQISLAEKAQKGLNTAFKANPIGLIVTAIGALVFAFTELFNRSETFRNAVNSITEAFTEFITENEAVQKILSAVKTVFNAVFNVIKLVTAAIAGVIAGVVEFIAESGILQAVLNGVAFVLGLVSDAISFTIGFFSDIVSGIGDFISESVVLTSVIDGISSAFTFLGDVMSSIPAFFAGVTAAIKQSITEIGEFIDKLLLDIQSLAVAFDVFTTGGAFTGGAENAAAILQDLQNQRQEIVDNSKTVGEAFNEAYNAVIESQEKAAEEQERLNQKRDELFGKLRNEITAIRSISDEERQALKDRVKGYEELTREQQSQLLELITNIPVAEAGVLKSAFEVLNDRKSKLETQIKELILAEKDFSKQQQELATVTAELNRVTEEFAEATRFAETELERLTRRQSELTNEIKEAIANGETYDDQLNELVTVTQDLNAVNEEWTAVQERLNSELTSFVEGSLADYDQRVKDLKEQQEQLNIASSEYFDLQRQINDIEQERSTILNILALDTEELANANRDLTSSLSDEAARNAAIEAANARIAAITEANEQGAEQIADIQRELEAELAAIDNRALQREKENIQASLQQINAAEQAELELVAGNEAATNAVRLRFANERQALLLRDAEIKTQLLNQELGENIATQEAITAKQAEEADKRKEIQDQLLSATETAVSDIFSIIGNVQDAAQEKALANLERQKQEKLQEAENFGASEKKKAEIEAEFDKKSQQLEDRANSRKKAAALAQGTIEVSLAILKALASAPPPANAVPAAIAAALGAIQLAVIASQKFALGDIFDMDVQYGGGGMTKFAKGAYLKNGAYHSQGGMPILNPFTGQKVAEIEKGEAIINKKSAAMFYDELSAINSYGGFGVSFPRAKRNIGGYADIRSRIADKGLRFARGGSFGFSDNFIKLQSGAVVNATATAAASQASREATEQNQLMRQLILAVNNLTAVSQQGFESIPSTAEELEKVNQLNQDERNAT
jgi:phage-related protein